MFIRRTFAAIASGNKDAVVNGISGTPIYVLGLLITPKNTETTVLIKSNDTAISAPLTLGNYAPLVLQRVASQYDAWFETSVGEDLSIQVTAGDDIAVQLVYGLNKI